MKKTTKTLTTEQLSERIADWEAKQFAEFLTEWVTCRPGMEFTYETGWLRTYLQYRMRVANTYRPEEESDLRMTTEMPEFVVTVQDFLDFLLGWALWFDEHEGREWFKVGGKPWRDPHFMGDRTNRFDPREVFDRAVKIRRDTEAAQRWHESIMRPSYHYLFADY